MDEAIPDIRSFRRSLRALERQVEFSLSAQTDCCGVTPAQCHLLLEVADREGASVAELAEALELDASTLSRAVDGLVKAGYLLRVEDPENRRRYVVSLAKPGLRKVAEIDGACDTYYRGMLSTLAPRERLQVAKLLPRLAEAMRSYRVSCDCLPCVDAGRGGKR